MSENDQFTYERFFELGIADAVADLTVIAESPSKYAQASLARICEEIEVIKGTIDDREYFGEGRKRIMDTATIETLEKMRDA